jgi:peptide-methionine (S)-S-oxide reductase
VVATRVGYCGGKETGKIPTYEKIMDFTECLQIDFDSSIVSLNHLLELFWSRFELFFGRK